MWDGDGTDEFQITASKVGEADRVWTRDSLATAEFIADQAVYSLKYEKAVVINVFGGTPSDPFYVIESLQSGVKITKAEKQ